MTEFIGNHLWQSTLFAVIAMLFTLLLRKNHARGRYWLWLMASLKFLIPFSLFIAIGSSIDFKWRQAAPVPQTAISYVEDISQPFGVANASPYIPTVKKRDSSNWIPIFLATTWLCGFLAVLLFYLKKIRQLKAIARQAKPLTDGRVYDVLKTLRLQSGCRIPIKLAISTSSMEPGVFGIFRPILLLPAGMIERLTDSELDSIIAHEIAHVRHYDNLVAAIHMVIEALFWFHPMIWWIGVKLVQERENACDEEALKLGKNPQAYAEGILKVCEFYLESPLPCASGVTGADMKKRIQAIMAHRIGSRLSFAKKIILAVAGFAALSIPVLIGLLNMPTGQAQSQNESKPTFEVASITFAEKCGNEYSPRPGWRMAISPGPSFKPGGVYSTCNSLKSIIVEAYGIEFRTQLSGGPDWSESDRYQIDAKAGNNANKEQMRLMLQSLLEERFKLKFHRENRESPVYFLIATKGGIKLQPAKDEQGNLITALPPPPDEKISQEAQKEAQKRILEKLSKGEQPGSLPKDRPGSTSVRKGIMGNTIHTDISASALSMDRLASTLTNLGDRRVINKTGITGFYDIDLHYAMDAQMGGGMIRMAPVESQSGPTPTVEAPSGPTIFTAMQEQLGLKLEADKAPLEYFIIDSIEKPSEN
jgi:bla regulator protein blaR1